jgi:hypothetical protein
VIEMGEMQAIILSGVLTLVIAAMAIGSMVLLSRGAAMRINQRDVEGRRAMAVGFGMVITAILAIPLIDLPWQEGDELWGTTRSIVGALGAAVLFAPLWWRASACWIRGEDDMNRLVSWSAMFRRRALPFTLGCIALGLSIRALAEFGM